MNATIQGHAISFPCESRCIIMIPRCLFHGWNPNKDSSLKHVFLTRRRIVLFQWFMIIAQKQYGHNIILRKEIDDDEQSMTLLIKIITLYKIEKLYSCVREIWPCFFSASTWRIEFIHSAMVNTFCACFITISYAFSCLLSCYYYKRNETTEKWLVRYDIP